MTITEIFLLVCYGFSMYQIGAAMEIRKQLKRNAEQE
jgi:hypothetical protein